MNALPEVIEGTWEEILLQADKFNGYRLRVTLLPEKEPLFATTGRYAARMREARAGETAAAAPEEVAQAEEELEELMNNLNENRRRNGAEPLF